MTFELLSQLIFCRFCNLIYNYCQNSKWKNSFRDFPVFNLPNKTKSKTRKPWKFFIFLLKAYLDLWAFVSVNFLSFLNLKLQLLSKIQAKEHFPRFPSFSFWVYEKIKHSETWEVFYLSSRSISWPLSFCLS